MPTFNIVVFGGDYAGPEVTAEAVKVCLFRSYQYIHLHNSGELKRSL